MARVIRLGLAGLALVAVVMLASCSPIPTTHGSYVATLVGTRTSPWIAAPTGWWDLSSKQSPEGCAQRIVVTNASEQTVATPSHRSSSPTTSAAMRRPMRPPRQPDGAATRRDSLAAEATDSRAPPPNPAIGRYKRYSPGRRDTRFLSRVVRTWLLSSRQVTWGVPDARLRELRLPMEATDTDW